MSFDPNVHVPGSWRCAKCGFRLQQMNLNAQDGTVTSRDQAGDVCPNDGAPLWRVTWKDDAAEAFDQIQALIDEKARLRAALELLRDLPIIENDRPDTLRIKGHAYTGPVVDYFFHTIRKIKEVSRAVLSPNPDRQED